MDREDSPWYPTMRLFRQTRPGQWEDVFQRIAEALQRRLAAPAELRPITVEIAPGELIDKITILEIKSQRMTDAAKLRNVRTELDLLNATWHASPFSATDIGAEWTGLRDVNARLWDIEDRIRDKERDGRFDAEFVELARAVYVTNDERAAIKKKINTRLGSTLVEEKSYADYKRKP
jgi:Family of unknown function (DUF6165)